MPSSQLMSVCFGMWSAASAAALITENAGSLGTLLGLAWGGASGLAGLLACEAASTRLSAARRPASSRVVINVVTVGLSFFAVKPSRRASADLVTASSGGEDCLLESARACAALTWDSSSPGVCSFNRKLTFEISVFVSFAASVTVAMSVFRRAASSLSKLSSAA